MKTFLLCSLLSTSFCFAAFEDWTSKDGRTAQFELIKVTGKGSDLEGLFRMRGGKRVSLKLADLDKASGEKLMQAAAKMAPAAASVFDSVLDNNLLKLEGSKLVATELDQKPTKYYIFYYTASWCGPCQAYTPSLVKFYEESKPGNHHFELILISSDRSEEAMTGYAVNKKMPWPHLKRSAKDAFLQNFNHGVRGIPSVIVCDLEGKIVLNTRDINELKKLVK